MKKLIIYFIFQITLLLSSKLFACSCFFYGDFKYNSAKKPFVALIKVIEYTDFLDGTDGFNQNYPYSMTVEVLKIYKGTEKRSKMKIWGGNGATCETPIGYFKIGRYYLIAPEVSNCTTPSECGGQDKYYIFNTCTTDFLNVNYSKKIALGNYSKDFRQISLKKFKKEINLK